MKIEVFRMNGKPVREADKVNFSHEFVSFFDAEIAKGRPATEEEWAALNEKLTEKENELKAKYPSFIEVSMTYMTELMKFVEENGALSVFIDTDGRLKLAINKE